MESTHALTITRGRYQLVLGDDVDVTAAEWVTVGDSTRLGCPDLTATWGLLAQYASQTGDEETLLIVSDPVAESVAGSDSGLAPRRVRVEAMGGDGDPLTDAVRGLDEDHLHAILAEAAAAAWRQRLSDASDVARQLTHAEAAAFGAVAVAGAPLLTELRAERRRALAQGNMSGPLAGSGGGADLPGLVEALIEDLRLKIRFGAAALAEAPRVEIAKAVSAAVAEDGWVVRLKLLLAAEEIHAIMRLMDVRGGFGRPEPEGFGMRPEQLLDLLATHRRDSEDLAEVLVSAVARLPATPTNPVVKVARRGQLSEVRTLARAVNAFVAVTSGGTTGRPITLEQAREEVSAFDTAAEDIPKGTELLLAVDGDAADSDQPSLDEAAALLGKRFERALPQARERVRKLQARHSDEDAEVLVARVKRQAVAELSGGSRFGVAAFSVPETVAGLAMEVALLRGLDLDASADFSALGKKILGGASTAMNIRRHAGDFAPKAEWAMQYLAALIQQVAAEAAFKQMSGFKPSKPGVPSEVFKKARSAVWGIRSMRGIADEAATGAVQFLLQALDGGSARLLVRLVDKSMPKPPSHG